jgi:hypothetical protein|tara:strand:+ start:59 stop:223 length:165 start_codon:yes stop_codon:yes gene_type:complete
MLERARYNPFNLGAHHEPSRALFLITTAHQSASMLAVAVLFHHERTNERIKQHD